MSLFVPFLLDVFLAWLALPLAERFAVAVLLLGSPAVWIFETVRHWRLLHRNAGTLGLAPVSARGRLLDDLGPGGVAAALRAELFRIQEALERVLGNRPVPYVAPAIGRDTGYYLVGLRQEASIPEDVREPEAQKIEQQIVLKVGGVTLPVGELLDTIVALIGAFPVPFRARYRRSLIEISLVNSGDQTRLTVSRAGPPRDPAIPKAGRSIVFTETVETKTLEDLGGVIRDAAFMILQIQGSFGSRWRSMRYLLDGLVTLDEYRRTGKKEARDLARQHMRSAAEADPENLEALYFHGVMTMVDQTDGAIDEAIRCFERTLDSKHEKLRSLAHTGLAYCLAQQWHRLGRRRGDVLEQAARHADHAEREWIESQPARGKGKPVLHPLIPYTRALVSTVDEGSAAAQDERTQRFMKACGLYREAIALQPDNGMFYNNLGWVLLKLAEWGVEELPEEHRSAEDSPRIASLSETYLLRAVGLNPSNKLTHANLCLLYSVAPFRRENRDMYRARSRYHGLKAVQIDPGYVNGHRDLAVALVRHGEMNEAYAHFTKALDLADLPEKDREIIADLVREVRAHGPAGKSELKRWQEPDPSLLEPRMPDPPQTA